MNVDFLIVGQGTAGSVLAYLLEKKGYSLRILDHPDQSGASHASAGICNPIVFRRLTTSWMVHQLLPAALSFYEMVENDLGVAIVRNSDTWKVFSSPEEQIQWKQKENDALLSDFLQNTVHDNIPEWMKAANGYGIVQQGFQIDIPYFLETLANHWLRKKILIREAIVHSELKVYSKGVEWGNISAKKLIFCEGYRNIHNPYFGWIPFKPVKGESLVIKTNISLHPILNKQINLRPMGNGQYWVGATYDWDQLDEIPTETGRKTLIDQLNRLLNQPFEVINHKAGVRPSIKDRRPVLGFHPLHPQLGIFNGLGTKGTMLAPYFAEHFIEHIHADQPLNAEVTLERFRNYYEESLSN